MEMASPSLSKQTKTSPLADETPFKVPSEQKQEQEARHHDSGNPGTASQQEHPATTSPPFFVEVVFDIPLQRTFTYLPDDEQSVAVGKRVIAPFGRQELLGFVIGTPPTLPPALQEGNLKKIRRVVDEAPLYDEEHIELARWLSSYYLCSLGEALAVMVPSGRRESAAEALLTEEGFIPPETLVLSEEQEKALSAILRKPEIPHYLYGITGSGKTEVFLRAAEATLAAGKSVIYLVPEIGLTHQLEEALQKRFGSLATTVHSRMTGSQRLREWLRMRRGEVRLVVGPRSAVFAPLQNLGLIIIDEEHDGSYKSGNTPRYHARQVAMKRCAMKGATLLLGSATPSVEAWKLMEEGKLERHILTRRLSGGAPPEIRILSLEGTEGCLTQELKEEIRTTARMGRQTILFLNRRGFAYFYHCKHCGYELVCKRCSVSLTYHKHKGRALCHYCGYSVLPPSVCPQCGLVEAGFVGFGTEMIEEEVRQTFPDLRVRRVDTDTLGKKGSLKEVFEVFRAGGIDILLGTQMVAKGLNFPGVRLVGVVLADTALHLPDFRAAERTFSLIVQVAGRAGRYFPDGKVLVQTFRPSDPAISRACAMDITGFYAAELAVRKELAFPPYTRLIRCTIRSRDPQRADRAAETLAHLIHLFLPADAELLGPADCPLSLIAGNHRRHIILRAKQLGGIHAAARSALELYEQKRDPRVYIEVDVDPVQLL
ncbi:MAG: primosomal protein N' [Breznakiellaceae bacterium]